MSSIESRKDEALKYFEAKFKIKIRNKDYYLEALTHSSFINENKK
jgi:dsRNA-specific ribonuclease